MKIKVKGLVFVGAAAAILLSAGAANAAKTTRSSDASGVVTSQKYSDEKYEYVADKVDGTVTGSSLVTAATNEDKYPSMAAMKAYTNPSTANSGELVTYNPTGLLGSTHIVTDSESKAASGSGGYATSWANPAYGGSDTKVPSEQAVISAINAVESSITQNQVEGSTYINVAENASGEGTVVSVKNIIDANADNNDVNTSGNSGKLTTAGVVQIKQSATNKYQVSSNADWTDVDNAIDVTSGDYLAKDSARTDGGVRLKIDPNKLVTTAAAVDTSGNGTKLVTASAVQKKTGADEKMMVANANGTWSSISNAVLDGTYVDVSAVNANGAVTLDVTSSKITTSGAQLAASDDGTGTGANGDEADLVTAKAVKEYVASTGLGGELAAMPDTCKNANAHCALVSSYDSTEQKVTLTWTPMAQ